MRPGLEYEVGIGGGVGLSWLDEVLDGADSIFEVFLISTSCTRLVSTVVSI